MPPSTRKSGPDVEDGVPVPEATDDNLRTVAELSQVPSAVRNAFSCPYDPESQPSEKEVWRLEWDGTVVLALVVRVREDVLRVVPVGDDPEFADPAAVTVDRSESPLGYAFGLWTAEERAVPHLVADMPLGEISDTSFELVEEVRRKLHRGEPLPEHHRLGGSLSPAAGLSEPRIAYRTQLGADLARLADVFELLATADEPETQPDAEDADQGGGLSELMREARLDADTLVAALGLELNQVLQLHRENLPLYREERQALAQLLDRPLEEITALAPKIDLALKVSLHRPRRRAQVRAEASRLETGETRARTHVAREAMGTLKRSKKASPSDWDVILDKYFAQRERDES